MVVEVRDQVKEVYSVDLDSGIQLFGNVKRKVRMVQCISDSDSLCRIKRKYSPHKIHKLFVHLVRWRYDVL